MIKLIIEPIALEGYLSKMEGYQLGIIWIDSCVDSKITSLILERINCERIFDFETPIMKVKFSGCDFLLDNKTITVANSPTLVKFDPSNDSLSSRINIELLQEPFYRKFGYINLRYIGPFTINYDEL